MGGPKYCDGKIVIYKTKNGDETFYKE